MKSIQLLNARDVKQRFAKGKSSLYSQIKLGLWTTGTKTGNRTVAWPEYEVDALIAARVSGFTDDQIRELVNRLHEARPKVVYATLADLPLGAVAATEGEQS